MQTSEVTIAELGSHRLWRVVQRLRFLDEASVGFAPNREELETAWGEFCQKHKIDAATGSPVPEEFAGCPAEKLKYVVERELRLAALKKSLFEGQALQHFQTRKAELDRVVYSLLRVKEPQVALELWLRISEGEESFAQLAPRYSTGTEVYTGGIVGPVALGAMHPLLAQKLRPAAPGELLTPFSLGEWNLIARVEHHLPAEFNPATKLQMINELFELWVEENCCGRSNA